MSSIASLSSRAAFALVSVLAATSCYESNLIECGAVTCPLGAMCIVELGCVSRARVEACAGYADGEACSAPDIASGYCAFGACVSYGCGDGMIMDAEECEPNNLANASCESLGWTSGTLACGPKCTFDESGCSGRCGDGVLAGAEQCEGAELGGASCKSLGFYDDTTALQCSSLCTFDITGCTGACGDGALNGPEQCDGALLPSESCVDLGYHMGGVECGANCRNDIADCMRFGWRVIGAATSKPLNDVWLSADDVAFAVGDDGTILRATGGSFLAQTSPTSAKLTSVWGASASDVYAVGAQGTVLHFDGTAWSTISAFTTADLHAVWGAGGVVYAAGAKEEVWRLTNLERLHGDGTTVLTGIWASSATDIHVVGDTVYLHSSDGGSTWDPPPPSLDGMIDITGTAPDMLYVVTPYSVMRKSGTTAWTPIFSSSFPTALHSVTAVNPSTVIAVGDNGLIARIGVVGNRMMVSSTPANLRGVTAAGGRVIAVGDAGAVRFDGADWRDVRVNGTANDRQFTAAWGTSVERMFLVGESGYVAQSSGGNFNMVTIPTSVPLHDIAGVALPNGTDHWIAVGAEGTLVYYSTVYGALGCPSPTCPTLHGVHVTRQGASWAALAVGDTGTIVHDDPSQTQVVLAPALAGYSLRAIWAGPFTLVNGQLNGDVWVIGNDANNDGAVFQLDTNGDWTMRHSTTSPLADLFVEGNQVIAIGKDGTIHEGIGNTWTSIATNVPLDSISGTASDLFVSGPGGLLHREGSRWLPVYLPAFLPELGDVFARPDVVILPQRNGARVFDRFR